MGSWESGEALLFEIELKKRILVETATINGLNSRETLVCSQELDEMINYFFKLQKIIENNR